MINNKKLSTIQKILIVGFGSIGKRHAKIIRNLYPNILVAILRHNKCENYELEEPGIDYCFHTVDDAIDFEPAAAIIANPATMHLDVSIRLASAGIHLMIEKPISSHYQGVKILIDICHKKDIRLMTAYNLRFSPSLMKFREMILGKNKIGDIYSVRTEVGSYLPNWRPGTDYKNGVSAQKTLGGGVLLELSHEIDYLVWLFGDVNWVEAVVSMQGCLDIDVEDTAHILFGFNGMDNVKEKIVSLNMDFIRHDPVRRCTIIGQNGSLSWNGIENKIQIYLNDTNEWRDCFASYEDRDFSYESEIQHFFECVEYGLNPIISGKDGMNVLKIIEAIKQVVK